MKTRYEEYHNSEVIMPCISFLHIHRRFDRPSQATNWHDNPEIQLCVEGEGFMLIDGERYDRVRRVSRGKRPGRVPPRIILSHISSLSLCSRAESGLTAEEE